MARSWNMARTPIPGRIYCLCCRCRCKPWMAKSARCTTRLKRWAIDTNQEQRLMAAEQRRNRVLTVLFAAIAAIVLASGWVGGSNEDKKQWSSTLTSIAIGVAALYFKSKDK